MGNVLRKLSCIILASLALSACSNRYSSSGDGLYLSSRNGAKMTVPSPLTSANIGNFYDLPPQTQDARISIEPSVEEITT